MTVNEMHVPNMTLKFQTLISKLINFRFKLNEILLQNVMQRAFRKSYIYYEILLQNLMQHAFRKIKSRRIKFLVTCN